MSARICVDYLSHEWCPNDLIQTHREIRRQVRKANSKHVDKDDNSNPNDKYRLARFENALWRQMGRTLTDHLGKHNPMVNPAVVDWQKESDVTWLYGPMYVVEHDDESVSLFTQKKKQRRRKGSVRFDPNVTQYSPPPIPTPTPSPLYALIDSDDDDDDDVVGNMFTGVSQSIQSYFFSKQSLSPSKPFLVAEFSIVCAAAAFLRSVASVLATWVTYKSLGRLIRRTWQIRQQEEPKTKHITVNTTTTITKSNFQ